MAGLHGRSPLLRLQSDERLIALVRRGSDNAFEALVNRYHARLLAFCRHMLGSREDAEDVLQEVFAAAYNAMLADERPINARPWLYRIARNRSLNHLRRAQPIGVDSMDVHLSEHGATTADKVDGREALRELVADVQELPETQRTALLLREIDALSYEQIAEAMETTIPSVKSLLVRARVSLAEAAEARRLSCEEVRYELGEVAEGLRHRTSPPVRRHLRACERCATFRSELRASSKALAMLLPVGPLLLVKKLLLAHLGLSAGAGSAGAGGTAAGTAATAATSGGLLSAGMGTIASKAAVGLAAAAAVTAGAVEIERHAPQRAPQEATATHAPALVAQAPSAVPSASAPSAATHRREERAAAKGDARRRAAEPKAEPVPATETAVAPPEAVGEAGQTQIESSATSLPVSLPAPETATTAPAPSGADAPAATPGGASAPAPATTTPITTIPPPVEEPAAAPPPVETPVDPPAVETPPADPPPPATEVPPADVPPADGLPADPPPAGPPAQP